MRNRTLLAALITVFSAIALAMAPQAQTAREGRTREYTYSVVRAYPHDPNAFTQGLVYVNGFLYESTGQYGHSSLRKIRLETGEVLQQIALPPQYFGEGIAVLRDEIAQLTWMSQKGWVYSLRDFRLLREFSYAGEGWGLTVYGGEYLMSDGSSEIRVLDSRSLREKRRIRVHDNGAPVPMLNELEIVEGQIFANVWQTDRIARISPKSGKVLGWIDLSGLLGPMYRLQNDAVLNGIAYDPYSKRLFVTGKLWPRMFEIRIVPKEAKAGSKNPA
jgi:glutaminyl-peptide cyclotransferase